MKQNATSSHLKWFALLFAWFTLGATVVQAQGQLTISKNADFSTQDRQFDEDDTIYMKVESDEVDFSSVRFSEFYVKSRSDDSGYNGFFENHFDGTYSAELSISELSLGDHLWTWEGRIEDDAGRKFETRILLKIGEPDAFDGFEVRAVVEQKGEDSFTLKGYIFEVSDETSFFFAPFHYAQEPNDDGTFPETGGEPAPASFQDVQVDYSVRARVEVATDGSFLAREVEIMGPVEAPNHITLTGSVESVNVDEDVFEVIGRTIVVNEETFFQDGVENADEEGVPEWAGRSHH